MSVVDAVVSVVVDRSLPLVPYVVPDGELLLRSELARSVESTADPLVDWSDCVPERSARVELLVPVP